MNYRKEIDGLRALAVVPVIFFHAGFQSFGGGYVGVDVFFVISGFLITSIILSEKQQGLFTLTNFYERRIRRILPALFFVMFVSLIFAWLWLIPRDLENYSQSLIAVSTFSSNILFWRTSGYWGPENELIPLLHTWSLAVEEQFYILFPLLLMLVWRFGVRWILASFLLISVSSLLAAQWGAYDYPKAAFFMLPTRAWELGIGAMIALPFHYHMQAIHKVRANSLLSDLFSLSALLMIGYAVFSFDHTTPFPGLYALVPTVATGVLIVFASTETIVGRFLGIRPLVGIGLISYSAYLWHQPLFAFARHRTIPEPSSALLLTLAALSLVLAYFTWRYIESPFRARGLISRRRVFSFAFLGSAMFFTLGLVGHLSEGQKAWLTQPDELNASFKRSDRAMDCFDFPNIHKSDNWKCEIGRSTAALRYFVVGDSHALSVFEAFDNAGQQHEVRGYFTGARGCLPFLEIFALRHDQKLRDCNSLNKRIYDLVASQGIDHLILVARWTYYTDGGYDGRDFSFVGLAPDAERSIIVSREAFKKGLKTTVDRYNAIGVSVSIIRQLPQQLFDPRRIYHKAYSENDPENVLSQLSVSKAEHDSLQVYVDSQFQNLLSDKITGPGTASVSYHDLTSDMCGEKCPVGTLTTSYYADDDHLSVEGTKQIEANVSDLLEGLMSPSIQ